MNCIPAKLKIELADDPFYEKCCITGTPNTEARVEWHHNLIYKKQVQEKFCILPLREDIHDNISKHKERCTWIMLNRATDEQLKKYSKAVDYLWIRERLNKKYGKYKENWYLTQ